MLMICVLFFFRALQHAVVGCGSRFEPFITPDLLQLIFTSLGHANRFVRESGFKVIASIVKCPGLSEATTSAHWPVISENLARGLADNWSQVCAGFCDCLSCTQLQTSFCESLYCYVSA